ncbi:MAG: LTA synthase family protein [Betaproteobacteria bacterium]|nr:LTA synthase family protein [Betaproteobacteria bacterium]
MLSARLLWVRVALLVLAIALLTRIGLSVLAAYSGAELGQDLLAILGFGLVEDLRVALLLSLPFLLGAMLFPAPLLQRPLWRGMRAAGVFLLVFGLLFAAVSEWVFWTEFSTRFNFIAIDYLLYTHEVVANIVQSYPVVPVLMAVAALAAAFTWLLLRGAVVQGAPALPRRALLMLLMLPPAIVMPSATASGTDPRVEELSRNGLASLVRAAWRNELDYHRFYATLPRDQANHLLAGLGVDRVPLGEAINPEDMMDAPEDASPFRRKPRHVVMITVESLSADYMAAFGNRDALTPNLDRLAGEGIFFTRLLATGTRTVRGLEAVSLGTPPVPGQAIVRRPGNAHLASLGEVLARQGVQPLFLYGGNGFFDNMNAYFGGNDYRVIDRSDIPDSRVTFENAWGVADEVLFGQSLDELDRATASGKRVFAHIMTTSNHRPYTYPEGRIDIASPGGRSGAVKYSDWAIGDFIAKARSKPWFKDTLFVILADHCASAAGKTRLPVDRYHIPMIFYAPNLLSPGRHEQLMSQIDLPPTLLEVMGLRGDAHFFGRSIYEPEGSAERAFVSNYQELGYLKDGVLTVLRPKRIVEAYSIDPETFGVTPTAVVPGLRDEAIAYYQTAADAFGEGQLALP